MKKRFVSMFLVVSMAASMAAGCGGKEESGSTPSDTGGTESTDEEDKGGSHRDPTPPDSPHSARWCPESP